MDIDFDKELAYLERQVDRTRTVGEPPSRADISYEALRRLKRLREIVSPWIVTEEKTIRISGDGPASCDRSILCNEVDLQEIRDLLNLVWAKDASA